MSLSNASPSNLSAKLYLDEHHFASTARCISEMRKQTWPMSGNRTNV